MMDSNAYLGLLLNASLLLSLGVLYDTVSLQNKFPETARNIITGVVIGVIGIGVMLNPWVLAPGAIFDTRSILLSVSALFLGVVPAIFAALITSVFRIYLGGVGAITGIIVITNSVLIGLLWRKYRKNWRERNLWQELYLFGWFVHLVLLASMLTFPYPLNIQVVRNVSFPVLIIFPVATVLLGSLMNHHLKRHESAVHSILINATLEERVKERTQQLETLNRELEAFSYSVSHDLRAPLRAIEGFSRILAEDYANRLGTDGLDLLVAIRTNTKKADRLIADLLALTKTTRAEMTYSLVDMQSTAQAAYLDALSAEEQAMVEISIDSLPSVYGDRVLLKQVWINLFSNALKFTAHQSKRKISVYGEENGQTAVYHIADNGVGFDSRYQEKLFQVFQRLHSQEEFPGSGIGLAIVFRIIQRHQGRVWASSRPGEETVFSFSLPYAEKDERDTAKMNFTPG